MDTNLIIRSIVECATLVLVSIITKEVVPYLRQLVNASRYSNLIKDAAEAVKAAEQDKSLTFGSQKKEFVLDLLRPLYSKWFTDKQINALIEAAVFTIKKGEGEDVSAD